MRNIFPLTALVLALGACTSQPPAPEQKPADQSQGTPQVVKEPEVAKVVAAEDPDLAAFKNPNGILAKRSVYFDYDKYDIKGEYQPLVEAHGKFLAKKNSYKVLIQGNADERGSREYNLALGQKRAEAVKKSLSLLGAREEQMEAVSLGKEKPRCTEHNEECWAQNRRGDLVYSEKK